METAVRKFFERYERFFNRSLGGEIDMDEVAALYAPRIHRGLSIRSEGWKERR